MKQKILLSLITTASTVASLQAATYTVQNTSTPTLDPRIGDSNGTLFVGSTGAATFGFFTNDAAVTGATSAIDLLDSDWNEFGSIADKAFNNSDIVLGDGLFSINGTTVDPTFNDKNIYLVVGNNTNLSLADEFFVFKFDEMFTGVDGSGTPTVSLTPSSAGTVLLGEAGPTTNTGLLTNLPTFRTESFSAAVPEPSSTALLGLGSVALLLRRRR